MSRLDIVPFEHAHLEDAARLLAARQARWRKAEPLLPGRFEEPAAALEELKAVWDAGGASGSAATRGGRLVGYVVGAQREPDVWGENVWIELAGHAVEEPEDARDLYAAAAARWVEEGRTRHYALIPLDDGLVDAWFRLGFGQQQAHGIRAVPARTDVRVPDGFEIRLPTTEDVEALIEVDLALPSHQRASPVFSSRPLPTADEVREEWARTLTAGEEDVLIACRGGKPVACWSVCSAKQSSYFRPLGRPEAASYLTFAATVPEARGSGIGVALTDACLARAAEAGYEAMVTDWRVTNLLASRFWPRRGFRLAFLRLYRSIP
jgi:ribosomal protein S18 acetylase RimI-like enzyme